ncbi:hypothetical protein AVEN_263725-1 [Araneus ventricosus]|uniref:Uncharacterized protein n=1 Tax=Araneus ventricosus TaxID=182803 RepID=A0A4Y2ARR0_ARAVE|nr:hypothetical protein AVEN_263725-1 [Araneus ventricosus]
MDANSVNNEFPFIGRMTPAFSNTSDLLNYNQFLSHRIQWRKYGHFEDPDSSPDVRANSRLSGCMVTLCKPDRPLQLVKEVCSGVAKRILILFISDF